MSASRRITAVAILVTTACVLLAALATRQASADIVVLTDGTRREGLVTTSPLQPDVVVFSDHVSHSLAIPRRRIREIIPQPEWQTRLQMAQALASEGKYERALEQIQRAEQIQPGSAEVQEEAQAIRQAMQAHETRRSEFEVQEAQKVLERIRELIKSRDFEKVPPLLTQFESEQVPEDVRREAAKLQFEYYSALGEWRADRTDTFGAIEAYEQALAINPEARDVYARLMGLYESVIKPGADADRAGKLQEFLEARVQENPNDLDARLRLANLLYLRHDWNRALENYLTVHEQLGQPGGADVRTTAAGTTRTEPALPRIETRVRQLMEWRHQEFARQNDPERAIEAFKEYQTMFPDIDPEPLYRYEVQEKARGLGPKDTKGRLDLIQYAERYGLEDFARRELNTLLQIDPKNKEGLAIVNRWAQEDLREIQTAFQSGLYAQVPILAGQFQTRFPAERYPGVQPLFEQAEDFVERARTELGRQKAGQGQRAVELVQSADENFQMGMNALYSYREGGSRGYDAGYSGPGTWTSQRYVGSYKSDAIMYFQRAIRYYREAMALDPTLADPARGDVRRKMSDSQRYLSLLTSQRITRMPPGPRSSRRFQSRYEQTYPGPGYLTPYGNVNPNPRYPYGYGGYPSVTPIYPYGGYPGYPTNPYGGYPGYPANPYGGYPGYPSGSPYGYPYGNPYGYPYAYPSPYGGGPTQPTTRP